MHTPHKAVHSRIRPPLPTTHSYNPLIPPHPHSPPPRYIDDIHAFGGTYMDRAFTKAFDTLDASRTAGRTSNCSTVILFMTDGINKVRVKIIILKNQTLHTET